MDQSTSLPERLRCLRNISLNKSISNELLLTTNWDLSCILATALLLRLVGKNFPLTVKVSSDRRLTGTLAN